MSFHRHPDQGARLNHHAHTPSARAAKPGSVAAPPNLLRLKGTGAPSYRPLVLLVLAIVALFGICASPAFAANTYKQIGAITGPAPEARFNELHSESVAVNATSGAVYVADSSDGTVYEFESATDATGSVFTGAPFGTGAVAVAVDDTSGDVFVADSTDKVINQFSAAGTLIRTIEGTATPGGEPFAPPTSGSFGIAVDQATGDLYAIDALHQVIDIFDKTGKYQRQITETPGELYGGGGAYTDGIAVNGNTGDLLVSDSWDLKVYAFHLASGTLDLSFGDHVVPPGEPNEGEPEPNGTLSGRETPAGNFGTAYTTVAADNASGNSYIADTAHNVVDAYKANASYAKSQIPAPSNPRGIAVDQASSDVYLAESDVGAGVRIFETIPIPDVEIAPATAVTQTSAVLHGTVDPAEGGVITDCHFVVSDGVGTVPCEPPAPISTATAVTATPTTLRSNTTYTVTLVAVDAQGPTESGSVEFRTTGPPLIESESASNVTATSVTLEGTVNPEEFDTHYRFEYISEPAFIQDANMFGPGTEAAPLTEPNLGSGSNGVQVTLNLQGLIAGTRYRYRIVAASAQGVTEGLRDEAGQETVRSFLTQPSANSSPLLDGRQWELVSPPEKRGAQFAPISEVGVVQASAAGDALAYLASAPTEPSPPGNSNKVQVFSARGSAGWSSRDIPTPNVAATGSSNGPGFDYRSFSPDLSSAITESHTFNPALSAAASEVTPFLREIFRGTPSSPCLEACYRPLVTACPASGTCPAAVQELANVPAGTNFSTAFTSPQFVAASVAGDVVLFYAAVPLIEGVSGGAWYQWAGGKVRLVAETNIPEYFRTMSDDGERVVYSSENETGLLMRDLTFGGTISLGTPSPECGECTTGGMEAPVFSADSSRLFFLSSGRLTADAGATGSTSDLYECQIVEKAGSSACDLTDLTAADTQTQPANVLGIVGVSADGARVYYVADPGGTGEADPRLYLREAGETRLVASLSPLDSPDWDARRALHTAKVSTNGRLLAFMSRNELTGYDNHDVASGKPDQEVFFYDGDSNELVCASCNPNGARPKGLEYSQIESAHGGLAGGAGVWLESEGIAANIPGWTPFANFYPALHQSRYLSDSGRLFFNSADSLVPQDTNGRGDVYEYEPGGVGDCTGDAAAVHTGPQGCISLISSGTSPRESGFLDASESGDDVFFLTESKLASQDLDTARDVYDAHVCSSTAPCFPPPTPAAPACEGDACQQPGTPPNDPTPGSLTFNGPGNLHVSRKPQKKKKPRHHKQKRHHKKAGTDSDRRPGR